MIHLISSYRWDSVARLVVVLTLLSGCDGREHDYYPLTQDHWWLYDISETILDDEHHARYLVRNGAAQRGRAGEAVVQYLQLRSRDLIAVTDAGVQRLQGLRPSALGTQFDEKPRLIIPHDHDQVWSVTSTLGLIESRTFARQDRLRVQRLPLTLSKRVAAVSERITTPAGTFEDCLRIDGTGNRSVQTDRGNSVADVVVKTSEWYAPGIGLVRLERNETSPSTFLKPGRQIWTLLEFGD